MSVTADWQGEFNGLTFGSGTLYRPTQIDGIQDTPDVRTSDMDRARTHGQIAGMDLHGGRSIQAAFNINAATGDPNTIVQAFSQAMVTGQVAELPLKLQYPGLAGGRLVQVGAKVRKIRAPYTPEFNASGILRASVEWWCTDPRIYDTTPTTQSVAMASVSGAGMTFNATFDLTFGGAVSGGTITATNAGEYPTPWFATINGPVDNPRIENVSTGDVVAFNGSLAAGETLVIDSDKRSVQLGGTASRYYWLTAPSRWFELAPGANQVRFAGTAGSGSMDFSFSSAWI